MGTRCGSGGGSSKVVGSKVVSHSVSPATRGEEKDRSAVCDSA